MSQTLLLDTDVTSYLFKRSPEADRYKSIVEGKRLALSFMSVAELFRWAVQRNWGQRKISELETTLRRFVVVPYDRNMAWQWAKVMVYCQSVGRKISASDAWIAATALRHDLDLVTNNLQDFETAEQGCGLRLIHSPQS